MGCSVLANLIATDLINGISEVAHDVEPVEDHHRLRRPLLDYLGIRLPHVAADALELANSFWTKEIKEDHQGICTAARTAPDQTFSDEVVDVRYVDMSSFSRDLIDAHMCELSQIALAKPVFDCLFDRRSHRAPRAAKQLRYLLPRQRA